MNHVLEFSMGRLDRATLARQVELLLARLQPTVSVERRRDQRVAMPVLFELTPLDTNRRPVKSDAVTVLGKNISPRGISFYHQRPLPYRRALISVVDPVLESFTAEIDVTWCRFTKPGWYESGGRLLAAVTPLPLGRSQPSDAAFQDPLALQGEACNSPIA